MSNTHTGNVLNSITVEEHDGDLNAKRVVLATGDIEIGAVEIKNSTDDTRATVGAGGLVVDLGSNNDVTLKGNVTLSDPKGFIGLATVNVGLTQTAGGKTLKYNAFAYNTTNLSGASIFINTAAKTYFVTSVLLNSTATVGVNFMSGVTYLTGNASIRMGLDPNSGFVENGSVQSPIYFGLAQQQSFSLVIDKAVAVTGKVIWYEE